MFYALAADDTVSSYLLQHSENQFIPLGLGISLCTHSTSATPSASCHDGLWWFSPSESVRRNKQLWSSINLKWDLRPIEGLFGFDLQSNIGFSCDLFLSAALEIGYLTKDKGNFIEWNDFVFCARWCFLTQKSLFWLGKLKIWRWEYLVSKSSQSMGMYWLSYQACLLVLITFRSATLVAVNATC